MGDLSHLKNCRLMKEWAAARLWLEEIETEIEKRMDAKDGGQNEEEGND